MTNRSILMNFGLAGIPNDIINSANFSFDFFNGFHLAGSKMAISYT
jgi:hypothetical protein